jgi:hypothetical protein
VRSAKRVATLARRARTHGLHAQPLALSASGDATRRGGTRRTHACGVVCALCPAVRGASLPRPQRAGGLAHGRTRDGDGCVLRMTDAVMMNAAWRPSRVAPMTASALRLPPADLGIPLGTPTDVDRVYMRQAIQLARTVRGCLASSSARRTGTRRELLRRRGDEGRCGAMRGDVQAEGMTDPNPMVGAVIVKDGNVRCPACSAHPSTPQ